LLIFGEAPFHYMSYLDEQLPFFLRSGRFDGIEKAKKDEKQSSALQNCFSGIQGEGVKQLCYLLPPLNFKQGSNFRFVSLDA